MASATAIVQALWRTVAALSSSPRVRTRGVPTEPDLEREARSPSALLRPNHHEFSNAEARPESETKVGHLFRDQPLEKKGAADFAT
jgi:hypothetical protein